MELLRPEVENRGVTAKTKLARNLTETPIDATQMQQLILNLCSNAEHAMRQTNGASACIATIDAGAALGSILRAPVIAVAVAIGWLLPIEQILFLLGQDNRRARAMRSANSVAAAAVKGRMRPWNANAARSNACWRPAITNGG